MSATTDAIAALSTAANDVSAYVSSLVNSDSGADDAANAAAISAVTSQLTGLLPASTPVDPSAPVVAANTPASVIGAGGAEKTAANPHGQV